ncbi:Transmembrane protein 182 [Heterocephalus glaber]|uniref:Transmembrane protein 182 n=1 Tax=Heterocephalus glaber TaxID=10181 RepID=G5AZE5_HETGA|nr:Transmembrane protein 182 [Heterocephalus glaber]
MRLNIAIFFGALFGALGVLLFLVAFGSDYWLLATEVERCSGEQQVPNQPPFKNCTHAYLSPYPFTRGQHNSTAYDSAVTASLSDGVTHNQGALRPKQQQD